MIALGDFREARSGFGRGPRIFYVAPCRCLVEHDGAALTNAEPCNAHAWELWRFMRAEIARLEERLRSASLVAGHDAGEAQRAWARVRELEQRLRP